MNVPGKKNNVTSVMIFIETVSVCVFCAISFISVVMCSICCVDALDSRARILLLCVFRKSRMPCSYEKSAKLRRSLECICYQDCAVWCWALKRLDPWSLHLQFHLNGFDLHFEPGHLLGAVVYNFLRKVLELEQILVMLYQLMENARDMLDY